MFNQIDSQDGNPGVSENPEKKKRGILLLHGICSNGNVFRPSVGPGLANLLSKDFQVSIGEIRSYARKKIPVRGASGDLRKIASNGWDFDHHLQFVIPRVWKEACIFFGQPPFVLGYSMGGMLSLVAQARGLIQAPGIMVVGAPVVFPKIPFYPPIMKKVFSFASLAGLQRIPIRFAARILIIYFRFLAGKGPHKSLLIFHSLARKAGADVPIETLGQALHWVNSTTFCDRTGKHDYLIELGEIKTPVFFLAGEADRIAPPSAVRTGYETVGSSLKHFATIPDAGHLELVAGEHLLETALHAASWFTSLAGSDINMNCGL